MNLLKYLLLFPIGILSASCVKTGPEACPPPQHAYTVRIGVGDKNYVNASEYDPESVKDENLPMGSYVASFFYELKKVGTADLRSARITPGKTETEYSLVFDGLTPGRYILSVWGNTSEKEVLHTGGDEGTDVYLGSDTLDYSGTPQTAVLPLRRAKGKLKVVYKNLPASVVRIQQRIEPVYQRVGADFVYTGAMALVKSVPVASSVDMLAAPTPAGRNTVLGIEFFTATDTDMPSFVVPDISRTLARNSVSLVEVDYHEQDGSWEIWGTVNGRWTLIHNETVEENP